MKQTTKDSFWCYLHYSIYIIQQIKS